MTNLEKREGVVSYEVWKWRMLSERRIYVAFWFQFVACWIWILPAVYCSHYKPYWRNFDRYGGSTRENDFEQDVPSIISATPGVFAATQIIMFIWSFVLSPIYGAYLTFREKSNSKNDPNVDFARALHSSQGYQSLIFTYASITASFAYIVTVRYLYPWAAFYPQSEFDFALSLIFYSTPISNHLGLAEWYMWFRSGFILILWGLYHLHRPGVPVTWYQIAASYVAYFIVFFAEECHEHDMLRMYDKLAELHHNISLNAVVNVDTDLENYFSSDVAYAFNTVAESLSQIETLMGENGTVEMVMTPKTGTGKNRHNEQNVLGYRWNKNAAHIYEARMLCLCVNYANISTHFAPNTYLDDGNGVFNVKTFEFSRMCMRVFSMLERSRGHGLALYMDDQSTNVVLTAPQGLCEMMLLMLIYEAVAFDDIKRSSHAPFPFGGICCARCEIVEGTWTISVSMTRDEKKNVDERIGSSLRIASQLAERYMRTHVVAKDFVDISNSVIVSHYSFRAPGTTMPLVDMNANSSILVADQSWLIIDCHASARDLRDYQQFISSLSMLGIPHMSVRGFEELVGWKKRHAVVVISETTLSVKQLDVLIDVQRVTAGSLVVISSKKTSPAHFQSAYGLDVAACMETSVRSIYNGMGDVLSNMKSRMLRKQL